MAAGSGGLLQVSSGRDKWPLKFHYLLGYLEGIFKIIGTMTSAGIKCITAKVLIAFPAL